MKKTLSQKLVDNLYYFTSNTKKRCITDEDCRYHGKSLHLNTKGCFVGALLPPKVREYLDDNSYGSVSDIIGDVPEMLPKIIKDNEGLMCRFQYLHDINDNWDANGLTERGVYVLENIIREYKLDEEPFKKCLPC
jgi:hypothetical protein